MFFIIIFKLFEITHYNVYFDELNSRRKSFKMDYSNYHQQQQHQHHHNRHNQTHHFYTASSNNRIALPMHTGLLLPRVR